MTKGNASGCLKNWESCKAILKPHIRDIAGQIGVMHLYQIFLIKQLLKCELLFVQDAL